MSQEKVEQYKASKKTRKQDIEKAKKQKQLKKILWIAAGVLVAAALAVGLIITGVNMIKEKKQTTEENFRTTDLMVQDMAGVLEDSTEAAEE